MKKIGILTYHPYDNYGAVLQAYALQTYIINHLNNDVEIIDFCTEEQVRDNNILQLKRRNTLRSLVSTLYRKLPVFFQLRKRRCRFDQFRKEYLHLTTRFKDSTTLFNNLPAKDIYISGSDQVFNPYAEYTDVYYLSFKKNGKRKVAYAPSFGVSNLEESINIDLQRMIKDFDYLSCREQVGADYLSKLLGKKVPCVLDPVFLLTKDEWERVLQKPKLSESYSRGYIFVYRLNGGNDLMKLARQLSEKTNLRIVCVAPDKLYGKGCVIDCSAGPLELLGLISGASYVVTDSFHGTALSLVFGVKIVPYIAFPQASSRITTLMGHLGLSGNIVNKVEGFEFDSLLFSDYSEKLKFLIASSRNFLQESLA